MRRTTNPFFLQLDVQALKDCHNFKDALNLALNAKQSSFSALAKDLNISYAQLFNLINCKSKLDPEYCFKLEYYTGVEAKYWWIVWWETYVNKRGEA